MGPRMAKSELRRLWNAAREYSLYLTVGGYVGIAVTGWLFCLIGVVTLEGAVLYTILTPLLIYGVYRARTSRHQRTIGRFVIVVFGGAALGFPIWISINYILYVPSWALLHGYNGPYELRVFIFILGAVFSYGLAAYIMDRLGKRIDYKPIM